MRSFLYKAAFVTAFIAGLAGNAFCSDTVYIKVHFLYGSKPKRAFKETEEKWFGGKLGGHVGIEVSPNKIIDFVPDGGFHWFAKKKECHSEFATHTPDGFWSILGGSPETVKRATVIIPITKQQKHELDSIVKAYTRKTPYDYAFIGMRCGAAAYEILAKLKILEQYSYRRTYRKIFYPKKLRKRLFRKAKENGWAVEKKEGTPKRKWERD